MTGRPHGRCRAAAGGWPALALVLALGTPVARADYPGFNFAAAPNPNTDGQWRGSFGAALSATSGNTRSDSLLLTGEAVRSTPEDKISLGGNANYARSRVNDEQTTTANKWGATGQYDVNISARAFTFVKLGLEADRLIQLDLRSSLSGGIGHRLVKTPEHSFDLFGGLGYTIDRYRSPQIIDGVTRSRFERASLYLAEESSHAWAPTVTLKQRLEVLPPLGGDQAVLVKFNATLNVAMTRTLSLSVGIVDTYNSKPPDGLRSNDAGLFTGINVKFGPTGP